jgi:PAS domain S-box-containing protein
VCRNGEHKVLSLTFRPVVNPEGVVSAIIIMGQDITERRRAEAALHESEEKHRNLVERASDGIVIVQDGIVKYANPWLARLSGYDPDEIVGSEMSRFIAPSELPKIAERYRRRIAGEPVPSIYETVLMLKNGTTLHAELNAGVINYEGKPADMVIVRDISNRKQAELELKESRERYRTLFQSSPVSLWEEDFSAVRQRFDELLAAGVTDLPQHLAEHPDEARRCAALVRVVDVNQATVRLYKARDKEQLLANIVEVFSDESYPVFRDELAALAQGLTVFEGVGINRALDGTSINIVVRCNVAPGCEQTLSRVFVSIVDVTGLRPFEPDETSVLGARGSGGHAEPRAPQPQNPGTLEPRNPTY